MRAPAEWAGDLKTMAGGYFFPLIDRDHAAELFRVAINERLEAAEKDISELLSLLKAGDVTVSLAARSIRALKIDGAPDAGL